VVGDCIGLLLFLDTYATRLLAQGLNLRPYNVTGVAYSPREGGHITQMSDFCCCLVVAYGYLKQLKTIRPGLAKDTRPCSRNGGAYSAWCSVYLAFRSSMRSAM
jgi:hypothetical protein